MRFLLGEPVDLQTGSLKYYRILICEGSFLFPDKILG